MLHLPPEHVTGYENTRPGATPYEPSDTTPMLTHWPLGVPSTCHVMCHTAGIVFHSLVCVSVAQLQETCMPDNLCAQQLVGWSAVHQRDHTWPGGQ